MFDVIRKLIGTKAPAASDDDGGFKNTFGKSYGTDHLLKMGWLAYFAATFPPGSKWVPKAGTWGYFRIEMHWYAGVMMMFETMGEVANSTNNPTVAGGIIGGSVDRLWNEFNEGDDDDTTHKAAFAAGCWFINMAITSMAKNSDRNQFHQNWNAINKELVDHHDKMKKEREG
jgi:hypothetical protein